eukprot:TRINITY_DN4173_c0_g1_i14.p1 TRINITY_DN4173_c0_g1~~TRINITY_DN4173_c0_g1_i14.p1  ORF type:complete len:265 (-),score=31.64 TRINITY_DN4173_c0_g1_i14:84-878(-)
MRYTFQPNEGYSDLLKLVSNKDYFVWTSNVDGLFFRSGFDETRIYTPQGDWKWIQCLRPCSSKSFWNSKEIVDKTLPHIKDTHIINDKFLPSCPYCGSDVFGNVRGGDWFLHEPYLEAQERLIAWLEEIVRQKKTLVILEIGAGFNTPVVTRFPMEVIASQLSKELPTSLIRLNPTHPMIPEELTHRSGSRVCSLDRPIGISLKMGWEGLPLLLGGETSVNEERGADLEQRYREELERSPPLTSRHNSHLQRNIDWKFFLYQLR